MNAYWALALAIVFEVLGTMLLPASQNFTRVFPTITIAVSYGVSFYFLAMVTQKLPLALVYATWAGVGVFAVALLSYFFYKQAWSGPAIIGLVLIVLGVTLVNVFKTV